MLTLERIQPDERTWSEMDAFPDRTIFETREWMSFVAKTQSAEPVVAALKDGGTTVGYYTGLIVERYFLRILGSPGPGWATWYMGFNLQEGVSRREALEALLPFAFGSLRCQQLELGDRELTQDDAITLGLHHELKMRLEIDLQRTEDEIWAGMTSACRRCIRKAQTVGVVVEEAADLAFADDYYDQLTEVFAKQGRKPTHDRALIREMIAALLPTGRLLLLRARDPEGRCIATGIFPGLNRTMYFWGGASWREHQILRPNEAIMWHAVRYWKARGVQACDLGGGVDYPYKRKYGPTEVPDSFRLGIEVQGAALRSESRRRLCQGSAANDWPPRPDPGR